MAKNQINEAKNRLDPGLGANVTSKKARFIVENGAFNVKKVGQGFIAKLNIYHRLINLSWPKFAILILSFYIVLNCVFAGVYYLIGIENLSGTDNEMNAFSEAFFFSSQTLTTVGYGKVAPVGYLTNIIAALESLLGLMIFSILTGLLYGRFSKPSPNVLFSKNLIVAPYYSKKGLMFRIANEKSNQIIKAKINVVLSRNETVDGKETRKYYTLNLERDSILFFPLSWTVVHPITKDSPIYGLDFENMRESDSEFLIHFEGIDDTYGDTIYQRHSYLYDELVESSGFGSMLDIDEDAYVLNLRKNNTTK